jgi:hypothetical protein
MIKIMGNYGDTILICFFDRVFLAPVVACEAFGSGPFLVVNKKNMMSPKLSPKLQEKYDVPKTSIETRRISRLRNIFLGSWNKIC